MKNLIDVSTLNATERVQEDAKVAAIAAAMGSDASDISWDEVPAIIIDEDNNVLDGHHRVAAAKLGLGVWRAIRVERAKWDEVAAKGGHVAAAKWAAEDDAVTWGAL